MEDFESKIDSIIRSVQRQFSDLEKRLARLELIGKIAVDGQAMGQKNQLALGHQANAAPLCQQLACSITAVTGLKEAVTTQYRALRFVWALLFCVGVGATIFYLYLTTDEYLARPTATSTQLVMEDTYAFPPLLLCPENWFDVEKAMDLGVSIDALKYSLSYLDELFPSEVANVSAARDEFLRAYSRHNFKSLLHYYVAIANDLESAGATSSTKSIYSCRGCANNTGLEYSISGHKFCYVFRIKAVEQVFGIYSAVRSIKIRFRDKTRRIMSTSSNWQVYFNTLNDTFVGISSKINIEPFHYSTVIFRQSKMIALDKCSSPCASKPDDNNDNYSSIRCMTNCHNNMYKNFLNCKLLWLSFPSSHQSPTETCNHMDPMPHNDWVLREFFYSDENARIDSSAADKCVKQCPRECERVTVETTLKLKRKMSEAEARWNPDTEDDLSSNVPVIGLCIKHGAVYDGGVTVLTEKLTYSFTQLVNNIGGTLGLFVGATVMTLAQLILFLVEYIIGKMSKNKAGQQPALTLSYIIN